MSSIGNNHSFIALKSAPKAPAEGQTMLRMIRHSIKDKEGKIIEARESMAALVPAALQQLTDADCLALKAWILPRIVEPAMIGICNDAIDKGALSIASEQLELPAIVEWLKAQAETAGRLSGEKIKQWYSDEVAPLFSVALAEKLGFNAAELSEGQAKRIEQSLAQYRDSFAQMASAKVCFDEKKEQSLRKVLALADADNPISVTLGARLDKMAEERRVAESFDF
jgi:hypothetical protein